MGKLNPLLLIGAAWWWFRRPKKEAAPGEIPTSLGQWAPFGRRAAQRARRGRGLPPRGTFASPARCFPADFVPVGGSRNFSMSIPAISESGRSRLLGARFEGGEGKWGASVLAVNGIDMLFTNPQRWGGRRGNVAVPAVPARGQIMFPRRGRTVTTADSFTFTLTKQSGSEMSDPPCVSLIFESGAPQVVEGDAQRGVPRFRR
jgi:hypothetical protein